MISESHPAECEIDPGPFPIEALNPVMRRIAEETAEVHGIGIELPALSTIAVVSGAIGKSVQLAGAVNGRNTFANLYVICAAPKSYGKGATSSIAQPLIDASEQRAKQFLENERPFLRAEREEIRAKIESMNAKWKKPGENHGNQLAINRSELAQLLKRETEIERLLKLSPTYWLANATPAAFVEHLARNNDTLFSFSPEAGELVRIALGKFARDEKGDFDLLLSGYSVEIWRDTRIARGDRCLTPCISVLWFCQPSILRELFGNKEAMDRGLTARLIVAVIESNTVPEDDGSFRAVSATTQERWQRLVNEILARRDVETPNTLECDPDAREIFREFHNESVKLRNGVFQDMEGELGRWRENALRIGIGQAVADNLTLPGEPRKMLSAEQAERAVKLARWAHLSALRAMTAGRYARLQERLQVILTHLLDAEGKMTLRDLERRHGFSIPDIRHLASVFQDMLQLETEKPERGRPSQVIAIRRATRPA